MEKWALALVVAARKLRQYFQAFPIVVVTNQPLRQMLHKPEASGRLVKWAIELSEFNISDRPQAMIKAYALADFIVEFIEPRVDTDHKRVDVKDNGGQIWQVTMDRSSSVQKDGVRIILESQDGKEIYYIVKARV